MKLFNVSLIFLLLFLFFSCENPKEEKYFTVTFDTNSSLPVPESQRLVEGSLINEPAQPVLAGYTFGGWYYLTGLSKNIWHFSSDTISKDMVLYAQWDSLALGQQGPGGGIIFYDDEEGFDFDGNGVISSGEKNLMPNHRYLEVEDDINWYVDPVNSLPVSDPEVEWGVADLSNDQSIGIPVQPAVMASMIGTGYVNSWNIYNYSPNQNPAVHEAAEYCVEYRGGGYDDWYLGSLGEMKVLRFRNYNNMFASGYYWTSSTCGNVYSWAISLTAQGTTTYSRLTKCHIRPIRAF